MLLAAASAAVVVAWLVLAQEGTTSGPVVRLVVPAARALGDLAAVATVGCLLGATVLLPGTPGLEWTRRTRWFAASWSLTALAAIPFLLLESRGGGASVITASSLVDFVAQSPQARAQLAVAGISATVAAFAAKAVKPAASWVLLALALLGTLPPVLTGHAGATGGPVAPTAIAMHVLGIGVWTGGVVALLLSGSSSKSLALAGPRFSRLAGAMVLVVGVSGVASALTRLSSPAQLVESDYGVLVLTKLAGFAVLVLLGAWHRSATLPALASGRPAAFLRLLAGEVVVFGFVIGVAVGLGRTPPPVNGGASAIGALAGRIDPISTPASAASMLSPYPDMFFATLVAVAMLVYAVGLRRVANRGMRWPIWRTIAWFAGWLLVLLATNTGVSLYGGVLASVYAVQHLTFSLSVPLLLVLGRPGILAAAALRPARDPEVLGPRECLLAMRGHLIAYLLLRRWVAATVYILVNDSLYLTGLYRNVLSDPAVRAVYYLVSVGSGVLLFRAVLGPATRFLRPLGMADARRLGVLAACALGYLGVAVFVLRSGSLLAAD